MLSEATISGHLLQLPEGTLTSAGGKTLWQVVESVVSSVFPRPPQAPKAIVRQD